MTFETPTTPEQFEASASAFGWDIYPRPVGPDDNPTNRSVVRIGCDDQYYNTDIESRAQLETYIQFLRAAGNIAWPPAASDPIIRSQPQNQPSQRYAHTSPPMTDTKCRHPSVASVKVLIIARPREDGGLHIWSDDVPGLHLSGADPAHVWSCVGPALTALLKANQGVEVTHVDMPPAPPSRVPNIFLIGLSVRRAVEPEPEPEPAGRTNVPTFEVTDRFTITGRGELLVGPYPAGIVKVEVGDMFMVDGKPRRVIGLETRQVRRGEIGLLFDV